MRGNKFPVKDLVSRINGLGFEISSRKRIFYPWFGSDGALNQQSSDGHTVGPWCFRDLQIKRRDTSVALANAPLMINSNSSHPFYTFNFTYWLILPSLGHMFSFFRFRTYLKYGIHCQILHPYHGPELLENRDPWDGFQRQFRAWISDAILGCHLSFRTAQAIYHYRLIIVCKLLRCQPFCIIQPIMSERIIFPSSALIHKFVLNPDARNWCFAWSN